MRVSLWPSGLQHARLPCPSPTPRAYSNSCPSSQWCHPTMSSSVVPFSSHLQSFLASGSFPVSQFFASHGHWSFSFNISPSKEYSRLIYFRMDWLDLLAVQETLKSLLQHHSSKAILLNFNSLALSFLYSPTLTSIHDHWKNHCLDQTDTYLYVGLPWWVSGKESACQCRRHRYHPWVGKILWRRKWHPTPVFLTGKSHGQRSLAGYSPWSHKESDTT